MMKQKICLNKFPIGFLCFKISTAVVRHLSVTKRQAQIFVFQFIQVDLRYMENSVRSC